MASQKTDFKAALRQLEDILALYLVKKAPFSLPDKIKELIVSFAPYLMVLGIILGVPSVLAAFGLGALVSPFTAFMGPAYMVNYGVGYFISMIAFGVMLVFQVLAVPGLFKRQRKGWLYLFYASLVSFVASLLSGNLIGAIIGTIIGWYVLFQVRESYQ